MKSKRFTDEQIIRILQEAETDIYVGSLSCSNTGLENFAQCGFHFSVGIHLPLDI